METSIENLIAGGETYTVEFKSDVNDDELTEVAVCLANGDGGQILLGVDDDGVVRGAQPRHGNTTEPRRLEALIANKTAPALRVAVTMHQSGELEVVVVNVPKAQALTATTAGRYVRRAIGVNGKPQCLPMMPHETQARAILLGGRDLSTSPLPELSISDLDPTELDRFRRLAESGGDEHLAVLSNRDLLSALGFRSVEGTLNLGAALLFGTPEVLQKFVPTHSAVFQVLGPNDTVEANRDLHKPLVRLMLELTEAVKPYNPEEEIEDGLFRVGLPRYSDIAVRELIANALVHRDYSINGRLRVAIEEPQTLSVSNPGGFPDGITVENLLTAPPQARNQLIADAFKRAGLVERTGRGINRVYRSQLALGRPRPDYSRSTWSWVEARLSAGPADRELAVFVAASTRRGQPLELQTLQVLHEVRTERRVTSRRAGELLQISADETRTVLNSLVERGLLESRGEGRGRTYHLSASVYKQIGGSDSYVRTRGFDRIQQEQMILTYVTEHGSAARAELAELCQITPAQASNRLRAMTKSGKLRMTGNRRTARYVLA